MRSWDQAYTKREGTEGTYQGELFRDTLEHFLNRSRVANEGNGHLEALGRDIADGGLDVVGDPLN